MLIVPSARAGEPTAGQPAPNIELPARSTKYVRADEPYEMDFFRADPKLLEQRFVTVIKFELPGIQSPISYGGIRRRGPYSSGRGSIPYRYFLDVETFHLWTFLATYPGHKAPNLIGTETGGRSAVTPDSLEEFLRVLARRAPKDKKPADEKLNRLTQAAGQGYLHLRSGAHVSNGPAEAVSTYPSANEVQVTPLGEIVILTPTAEEGEEMAKALLSLFDFGLSRPSMQEAVQARREAQRQLAESEVQLAANQQNLAELQSKLASDAEVSADDLVSLKTQLHLLAVDEAGAEARIRATEEILAKLEAQLNEAIEPGAPQAVADRAKSLGSHVERVENIKITAEIDLAGMAARRDLLEHIIGRGTERKKLESQLGAERQKADNLQLAIDRTQETIQSYDDYFVRLGPLRLVDNQAVIRPIRWRQPESR